MKLVSFTPFHFPHIFVLVILLSRIVFLYAEVQYQRTFNDGISKLSANFDQLRGGDFSEMSFGGSDTIHRADFIVGKDREIFHASIDLRWLFEKLINKVTWKRWLDHVVNNILRLNKGLEIERQYQKDAIKIIVDIEQFSKSNYSIRALKCSLLDAQKLSRETQRFILCYFEEKPSSNCKVSVETLKLRQILANEIVGRIVNNQFLFLPSYVSHPYARLALSIPHSESEPTVLEAPFLFVLAPKSVKQDLDSIKGKEPEVELEVLGSFRLTESVDATEENVILFLLDTLLENKERLSEEMKIEIEELVAAAKSIPAKAIEDDSGNKVDPTNNIS